MDLSAFCEQLLLICLRGSRITSPTYPPPTPTASELAICTRLRYFSYDWTGIYSLGFKVILRCLMAPCETFRGPLLVLRLLALLLILVLIIYYSIHPRFEAHSLNLFVLVTALMKFSRSFCLII